MKKCAGTQETEGKRKKGGSQLQECGRKKKRKTYHRSLECQEKSDEEEGERRNFGKINKREKPEKSVYDERET